MDPNICALQALLQLACGRRDNYYFATVLDSKKAQ
jgi:hypothetical protein